MPQHIKIYEWPLNLQAEHWELAAVRASILKALEASFITQGTGDAYQPSIIQLAAGPLLQFQLRQRGGCRQVMIQALHEQAARVRRFLDGLEIAWREGSHELRVLPTRCRRFRLRTNDTAFYRYRIYNYLPLRSNDLRAFQEAPLKTRLELLSGKLSAHLASFYQLVLNRPIEVQVQVICLIRRKQLSVSGNRMLAFDLSFITDRFLPEYVGMGPGAARGLGVIRQDGQLRSRGAAAAQTPHQTSEHERLLSDSRPAAPGRTGDHPGGLPPTCLPLAPGSQ